MNEPTEFLSLMAQLRTRDPAAASEVCRRFEAIVRVVVRRHLNTDLRTQFDAIDFVQDVWATIMTSPPERYAFETPAAFGAFLARVARDKVIDASRHLAAARCGGKRAVDGTGARQTTLEEVPSRDPQPCELALAEELWQWYTSRLPEAYRAVATLLREGYTHEEIAGSTGASISTIKRTISRLRAMVMVDTQQDHH